MTKQFRAARRVGSLPLLLIASAACLSAPLSAAQSPPQPRCAAEDVGLPPALSAWTAKTPLVAAKDPPSAKLARLTIGKAVAATLAPMDKVAFIATPGKPGAGQGGLFSFKIERAGEYRVALGAGAWIDVVRDGKAIASASHDHGPPCSTIRKIVNFDLQPGEYGLQISGSPAQIVGVLILAR